MVGEGQADGDMAHHSLVSVQNNIFCRQCAILLSPKGLQRTTRFVLTFSNSETIDPCFIESHTPPRKLDFILKFLELAYLNPFTKTISSSLYSVLLIKNLNRKIRAAVLNKIKIINIVLLLPVSVAARSKAQSTAARLLSSWVRIPPGAWMSVCCECFVFSGRGLCDELITRPEESYRLWCVAVCY